MTSPSIARMRQARQMLAQFRTAGRPSGAKPDQVAALQRSPVGWLVARDAFCAQIEARNNYSNTPRQLNTSYCGPAAFLYCVLEDRPDVYVAYAIALWLHGSYDFRTSRGTVGVTAAPRTVDALAEINRRRVTAGSGAQISDLDWMTMAALSASTRPLAWARRGADPDDVGRSITYPWVLKDWFAAAGSRPVVDSMGLGALKSSLFMFVNLMRFWRTHWLVLQIDSSLIEGGAPNTTRQRHWVVVNPHYMPRTRRGSSGPVVPFESVLRDFWNVPADQMDTAMVGEHLSDWPMELSLVTWGKEDWRTKLHRLGDVPSRFYGGFAFPRIG